MHRFWDATTHNWTYAGDLRPSDQLTTATPHTSVTVTAVHSRIGAHDMRNLTVNAIHTYYVIAGTTPVLVHNCFGGTHRARGPSTLEQLEGQRTPDPNYQPRHSYDRIPNHARMNVHAGVTDEEQAQKVVEPWEHFVPPHIVAAARVVFAAARAVYSGYKRYL